MQSLLHQVESNVAAVEARLVALGRQLDASQSDLQLVLQPFSAEMTIDQAWNHHSDAPDVFARHHLPACNSCAVRFDETLEEAAAAYGLQIDALITELNTLLTGP